MELIFGFLVGAVAGSLTIWFARSRQVAALTASYATTFREAQYKGERIARLEAELQAEKEKYESLREVRDEVRNQFKALSADALRESNDNFLKLAKSELAGISKPIESSLKNVDSHMSRIADGWKKDHGSLGESLRNMGEQHQLLRRETAGLSTALRAPVARGQWGEIQLKRVCEMAGMIEYCDFVTQSSTEDDEGSRLRPDVIIRMPGGAQIVVDSKTSLGPYIDAVNAEEVEEKEDHLQRCSDSVKTHLESLSKKAYWDQFDNSPDFVVMFIPMEAMYGAILEQNPDLIERGFEQKVLIATPTSLLGLLRAIHYGWRQEQLAENAAEISKAGSDLYNRLAIFIDHFNKAGQKLDGAISDFNNASRSWESRLVPGAERLKNLGVQVKKDLPPAKMIDRVPVGIPEQVGDES